jgi:hypothetical protein
MRGYVVVPANWQKKPDSVRDWVKRSLTLARAMPAKGAKAGAAKKKAPPRAKKG